MGTHCGHQWHGLLLMEFRVIIAGGRDFSDYSLLRRKCDVFFRQKTPSAILSGMARGADSLGVQYANEKGIPVQKYPADWNKYGRRAGMVRNRQMLEDADALVAFWDGASRGTANMITIAKEAGIPVRVVSY